MYRASQSVKTTEQIQNIPKGVILYIPYGLETPQDLYKNRQYSKRWRPAVLAAMTWTWISRGQLLGGCNITTLEFQNPVSQYYKPMCIVYSLDLMSWERWSNTKKTRKDWIYKKMIKEKQTINAEMKTNKADGLQGYYRVNNNSIDLQDQTEGQDWAYRLQNRRKQNNWEPLRCYLKLTKTKAPVMLLWVSPSSLYYVIIYIPYFQSLKVLHVVRPLEFPMDGAKACTDTSNIHGFTVTHKSGIINALLPTN